MSATDFAAKGASALIAERLGAAVGDVSERELSFRAGTWLLFRDALLKPGLDAGADGGVPAAGAGADGGLPAPSKRARRGSGASLNRLFA